MRFIILCSFCNCGPPKSHMHGRSAPSKGTRRDLGWLGGSVGGWAAPLGTDANSRAQLPGPLPGERGSGPDVTGRCIATGTGSASPSPSPWTRRAGPGRPGRSVGRAHPRVCTARPVEALRGAPQLQAPSWLWSRPCPRAPPGHPGPGRVSRAPPRPCHDRSCHDLLTSLPASFNPPGIGKCCVGRRSPPTTMPALPRFTLFGQEFIFI